MSKFKTCLRAGVLIIVFILSFQNIISPQEPPEEFLKWYTDWDTLMTYSNYLPIQILPYTEIFTSTQDNLYKNILEDTASFEPLPGPSGGYISGISSDSVNGFLFISTSGEVYRSSDNGMHWEHTLFPSQLHNSVSLVKITGTNKIFVETDFYNYMSTTWGDTWDRIFDDVRQIVVESSREIYAGSRWNGARKSVDTAKSWYTFALAGKPVWRVVICEENKIACPSDSGFYYSIDSGEKWVYKKYDSPFTWNLLSDRKGHLFVQKWYGYGSTFDLYRSDNFGESWYKLFLPVQGDVGQVYLDKEKNLYALVKNCILKSKDAGGKWDTLYFPYGDVHAIGWDADNFLLAACQDGVFRKSSSENKWDDLSYGIHARRIEKIIFPDDNSILALSLQECFKSTDNGISWMKIKTVTTSKINYYPASLKSSSGKIFLAAALDNYSRSGFLRSADNGITWEPVYVLSNEYHIEGIAEGPAGEIYTGTYCANIYRSTDEGDTWVQVYSGRYGENIKAFAADKKGNIYALKDSVLLRSEDGLNWTEIKLKQEIRGFWNSISFDKDGNTWLGSSGNGMLFSSDSGSSWEPFNEGLNNYVMSTTADNKGNIAAGTSSGPYLLKDSVNAWTAYRKNFPVTFTTALTISPEGILYVGTQDFGMYRLTVPLKERTAPLPFSQDTISTVILDYTIFQNYPNPFNSTTIISWQQPVGEHVTIKIYDILGREAAVLVTDSFETGYHKINFNASSLASGMYILNFRIGNYVGTKKMILIR